MGFTLHPVKIHNAAMNMVDGANQMNRNCLVKCVAKAGSNALGAVTGVAAGIFETAKLVASIPTTFIAVPTVWAARKITCEYFEAPRAAYEALPKIKDWGVTATKAAKQFAGVILSLGGVFVIGSKYNVEKQHSFGNVKIERIVREAEEAKIEEIRSREQAKIEKKKQFYQTVTGRNDFDNKVLLTMWRKEKINSLLGARRHIEEYTNTDLADLETALTAKNQKELKENYLKEKDNFKFVKQLVGSIVDAAFPPAPANQAQRVVSNVVTPGAEAAVQTQNGTAATAEGPSLTQRVTEKAKGIADSFWSGLSYLNPFEEDESSDFTRAFVGRPESIKDTQKMGEKV